MDLQNLKVSTAETVLLKMVMGGNVGGLQVVLTAPQDQLFILPSVCSLVTVSNEADDCCLQEFDRRVTWGTVISVEREQQGGEHTSLGGSSADGPGGCDFPQPHLLFVCDALTDWSWHSELGEFGVVDFWDDGVERRAEVHRR